MFNSHVHPDPAGKCMYSAIWQSASSPEETPPAKSHQPQKPRLLPVAGKLNVPTRVVCQFAFPYPEADGAKIVTEAIAHSAITPATSKPRRVCRNMTCSS